VEEKPEVRIRSSGLTPRAIIWGLVIGIILQATIYYMTMALGFSTDVSGLSALFAMLVVPIIGGKTNRYEINIVQTLASTTAAMAIPLATYYIVILQRGETVNTVMLIVLLLFAGLVGIVMNAILRKHYIHDTTLPFPIPTYVAEVVKKTDDRDKIQIRCLWIGIVIGIIFTLIQDGLGLVPGSIQLTKGLGLGINLVIGFTPLAMALGYIVGKPTGLYMLGGALFSGLVISPIATAVGWIPNPNTVPEGMSALTEFNLPLFLGITVAGTFAFLLRNIKQFNMKGKGSDAEVDPKTELPMKLTIIVGVASTVVVVLIMLFAFGTNPLSLLGSIIVGSIIIYIYTRIQAQTGMGVQSYLTFLAFIVTLVLIRDSLAALVTITIIGVIGALSGDTIADFKTGQLLGASPRAQYISQFIGFAPSVVTGVILVSIMVSQFGIATPEAPYPAAQIFYATAQAGTGTLSDLLDVTRLIVGSGVGLIMGLFSLPVPVIGVSLYLPMGIMMSGGLGCLIRMFVKKRWGDTAEQHGMNVSAGISIGAGIIITVFTYTLLFM